MRKINHNFLGSREFKNDQMEFKNEHTGLCSSCYDATK